MSFWVSSTTWKDCGNPQHPLANFLHKNHAWHWHWNVTWPNLLFMNRFRRTTPYIKLSKIPKKTKSLHTSHPPSMFHKKGALVKRSFLPLGTPVGPTQVGDWWWATGPTYRLSTIWVGNPIVVDARMVVKVTNLRDGGSLVLNLWVGMKLVLNNIGDEFNSYPLYLMYENPWKCVYRCLRHAVVNSSHRGCLMTCKIKCKLCVYHLASMFEERISQIFLFNNGIVMV